MKKIFYSIMALVSCLTMTSCSSGDPEFPDFDYQTVYFASNVMMRTVELGKDMEVDLTMRLVWQQARHHCEYRC